MLNIRDGSPASAVTYGARCNGVRSFLACAARRPRLPPRCRYSTQGRPCCLPASTLSRHSRGFCSASRHQGSWTLRAAAPALSSSSGRAARWDRHSRAWRGARPTPAQITRRVIAVSRFPISRRTAAFFEVAGVADRRLQSPQPARGHGAAGRDGRHLHGRHEVRRQRAGRPHLGRELLFIPRLGLPPLRFVAHGRILDRQRISAECPRDTGRANRISQRQWASTP